MPTPDAYRRRYERAEAERLRLAQALQTFEARLAQLVNTAADDQQRQIDALERLLLNRASLVGVAVVESRTLRFTFTRRGQVHQVDTYNALGLSADEIKKVLLDD